MDQKNKDKVGSKKASRENSGSKGKGSNGELQFKPKSLVPTPTHKSSYGFGKF